MAQKDKRKKGRSVSNFRVILFGLIVLFSIVLIVSLVALFVAFDYMEGYFIASIVVLFLLDLVLAIFIANSQLQVDFKVSWLAVILALPLAGAIIYLIFAQKPTIHGKIMKRNIELHESIDIGYRKNDEVLEKLRTENNKAFEIANTLDKTSKFATYQNTGFQYFKLGEEGFPKMVEELKKAKRFIFFEFFIIEYGEFLDTIYDILVNKVKEGVDVRFIYDDFGSAAKVNQFFYERAREDGIKCFAFNKMRPTIDFRQNNRDHRKILIIDGVTAFSGGCNIADEYINKVQRFGHWKDNIFMIKGQAVDGYTNMFLSTWKFSNDLFAEDDDYTPFFYETNKDLDDGTLEREGFFTPYGDIPFDRINLARNAWLTIINRAQKYVYISTPYLIPDSQIITALKNKARSGVKVVIVTPGIPDKPIIYKCTRSYYTQLMIAGVEIYEYTPGFNHAKIIVSDDIIASTGTTNMDYRSFYLHFECSLLLSNSKGILDIRDDMLGMIEASKKISVVEYLRKNWLIRWGWAILRIIAPLF